LKIGALNTKIKAIIQQNNNLATPLEVPKIVIKKFNMPDLQGKIQSLILKKGNSYQNNPPALTSTNTNGPRKFTFNPYKPRGSNSMVIDDNL